MREICIFLNYIHCENHLSLSTTLQKYNVSKGNRNRSIRVDFVKYSRSQQSASIRIYSIFLQC